MSKKCLSILAFLGVVFFLSASAVKAAECGILPFTGQANTFEQFIQLDSALSGAETLVFFIHNDTQDSDIVFIRNFERFCSGTRCSLVSQDFTSQLSMLENIVADGNQLSVYVMRDPSPVANFAIPPVSANAQEVCSTALNLSDLTAPQPPVAQPQPEITNPAAGLTSETLDALNPLTQFSTGVDEDLNTPGGILTRVLRFAFPLGGLILFIMLIWAGFEILSGASSGSKSIDAGKQRATAAIIGFILLFISYFIAQLLEVVFGIQIL